MLTQQSTIKCKNCNAVFANKKMYNMHIMLCTNFINESKKEEKTEEKKTKRTTKKKKSGEDA